MSVKISLIFSYYRGLQAQQQSTETRIHNLSELVRDAVEVLGNLQALDVKFDDNWQHSFLRHRGSRELCRHLGIQMHHKIIIYKMGINN